MGNIINPYRFAVGGSGSAHRYWMFEFDQINGSTALTIGEIEAYETTGGGGTDVLSGETITANGTDYSSSTSSLNDGNTATWWGYNSATRGFPAQLKVDFGAGNEKDLQEVKIWQRSTLANQAPSVGTLQYSDDDVIYTVRAPLWNRWASSPQTFTQVTLSAGEYQHFQWEVTADNGASIAIREIELRESVSGPDALPTTPDHVESSDTGGAVTLFNDNTSSGWTETAALPIQVWVDGDVAIDVAEMSIMIGTVTTGSPQDFTLKGWNAATASYDTIISETGITGWTSLETKVFTP